MKPTKYTSFQPISWKVFSSSMNNLKHWNWIIVMATTLSSKVDIVTTSCVTRKFSVVISYLWGAMRKVNVKSTSSYASWSAMNQGASPGPRFNIKMSSYQYRKSHCGDKTVVRSSYLHNGIPYTGKMTSLYWFSPLGCMKLSMVVHVVLIYINMYVIHMILLVLF